MSTVCCVCLKVAFWLYMQETPHLVSVQVPEPLRLAPFDMQQQHLWASHPISIAKPRYRFTTKVQSLFMSLQMLDQSICQSPAFFLPHLWTSSQYCYMSSPKSWGSLCPSMNQQVSVKISSHSEPVLYIHQFFFAKNSHFLWHFAS